MNHRNRDELLRAVGNLRNAARPAIRLARREKEDEMAEELAIRLNNLCALVREIYSEEAVL